MTISFKGAHFPKDVILRAVFFYLRYGVSYRALSQIPPRLAPLLLNDFCYRAKPQSDLCP